MSDLFYVDNAVTYVRPHNLGVQDIAGHDVSGWIVQYDPQQISLDDAMEKLTKVYEVLRIVQWEPGILFVIRKPVDIPFTALELQPAAVTERRPSSRRHG
jgi:hypothetical protein